MESQGKNTHGWRINKTVYVQDVEEYRLIELCAWTTATRPEESEVYYAMRAILRWVKWRTAQQLYEDLQNTWRNNMTLDRGQADLLCEAVANSLDPEEIVDILGLSSEELVEELRNVIIDRGHLFRDYWEDSE